MLESSEFTEPSFVLRAWGPTGTQFNCLLNGRVPPPPPPCMEGVRRGRKEEREGGGGGVDGEAGEGQLAVGEAQLCLGALQGCQ